MRVCLQFEEYLWTVSLVADFCYFIEIKSNMENYYVCKGLFWGMCRGIFQSFELV